MARSSSYPRGYGSPVIYNNDGILDAAGLPNPSLIPSQSNQLHQLYVDYLNLSDAIKQGNANSIGAGVPIYTDILNLIATPYVVQGDAYYSTTWIPNAGVSQAVVSWLVGAIGINSNDGQFGSNYVRNYTAAQFFIRNGSGSLSTADINNKLNIASNKIAATVALDIIQTARIPDISTLGAADAGTIAADIFGAASGGYYPNGDYAGWAGATLFSYLGAKQFYGDWILNSNSFSVTGPNGSQVDYKQTPGSYDLVSTIKASLDAGRQSISPTNFLQAIAAYFGRPAGAVVDSTELVDQTNSWFQAYYSLPETNGFSVAEFLPGPNLVFSKAVSSTVNYVIGTLAGKTLDQRNDASNAYMDDPENPQVNYKSSMIVGGPNNDTIYGFDNGNELIDGGYGNNIIYAGHGNSIIYGGGPGANIIHGNTLDNTDGYGATPSSLGTIDILVRDGGNATAADVALGDTPGIVPNDLVDTFYAESNSNIMIGGNAGNVFNIGDPASNPRVNIIWGRDAPATYNFIDPVRHSYANMNVCVLYMNDPSVLAVCNLDILQMAGQYAPDFYGALGYHGGSLTFIINPTDQDVLTLDGQTLTGTWTGDYDDGTPRYVPRADYEHNGDYTGTLQVNLGAPINDHLTIDNFVNGDFGINVTAASYQNGVADEQLPSFLAYNEQHYI